MGSHVSGSGTTYKFIHVCGARQHNLRDVNVDIPREKMTVITGPSGSGKSSLAFDTIYAEGQRKYVESLSVQARQSLAQMPKPDVESIDGLMPCVAIEQRVSSTSPRSTVATATEIYDFLRLLFARAGTPTCWECGREITRQSVSQIVDEILSLPMNSRFMVLAPILFRSRGDHAELLCRLSRQGFVRARIDGEIVHLEDVVGLDASVQHTIEVIVDRLQIKQDVRSRVVDSVELALRLAGGRVIASVRQSDGRFDDHAFSSCFCCADHPEVTLEELSPRIFSFNSPHGACARCHGLGTVLEFDAELIVADPGLPIASGAIHPVASRGKSGTTLAGLIDEFCRMFSVSPDTIYRNIPSELGRILMRGTTKADIERYHAHFRGLVDYLHERWDKTTSDTFKEKLHEYMSEQPCHECSGGRLCRQSLAVKLAGRSIAEVCRLSIAQARTFLDDLAFEGNRQAIAEPVLRELRSRLRFLCDVGVEYLALDRSGSTLSGGEAQRLRLATQIGSGLVGVCYVLDEPTIGLHPRDSSKLVATLEQIVQSGNTVIVVEHDEIVVSAADYVIDMGPGAGLHGGEVVAHGSMSDVLASPASLTAQYLTGVERISVPQVRRQAESRQSIRIHKAAANNLKNIDVVFPLGTLTCVTGVSGSGKSTLVTDILMRHLWREINGTGHKPGKCERVSGMHQVDRVIEVDQCPLGRSPRSNAATYVGAFDLIRKLYAKTREAKLRGYSSARFSFNAKGGRCEECQGQGTKRIEMHFLPDVYVECGACNGSRYNRETLEIRYRGKTIADVLNMRMEDALVFFSNFPKIAQLLKALVDVGLGYLPLGQSSITLSGGEAQRVKLSAELGKTASGHTLYIMDEPTTGLHVSDVHNLVNVMSRLVNSGHTVVVIEHNLDVIKMADWVIDLGPEGGAGGGRVLVAGTPEEVAACQESYTGRFLRQVLSSA